MLNKQRTKGQTSTRAPITSCREPLCASTNTVPPLCVRYLQ